MNTTILAKAAITAAVGIGVGVLNDPLAGLVIGFMLAQLLFVYPKYQQMQLAAVAARRDRRARSNDPEQAARRDALLRYLATQFAALGIVLLAASGLLDATVAIALALPALLLLMWVQLRILK